MSLFQQSQSPVDDNVVSMELLQADNVNVGCKAGEVFDFLLAQPEIATKKTSSIPRNNGQGLKVTEGVRVQELVKQTK